MASDVWIGFLGAKGLTTLFLIMLLGRIRPAVLSFFRRFFLGIKSTEAKSVDSALICVSLSVSLDSLLTPLQRLIG